MPIVMARGQGAPEPHRAREPEAAAMRMTEEGVSLIKRFEGFRAHAYRDAAGAWTIGYGHTSAAGEPQVRADLTVTKAEAGLILKRDVDSFAQGVRRLLKVALTPAQFSALVSFAYNVGLSNFSTSSVLKAVNAGEPALVPRRLQLWVKANGRVLPGLVRRRAAEAALFAGGADEGGAGTVEPIGGTPAYRSTTNIAAVLSALAALLSALAAGVKDVSDALGSPLLTALLLAVTIVATAWIVRERGLKAREEGV